MHKVRKFSEKSFLQYQHWKSWNIACLTYDKVALLMRCSVPETRNCHQIIFRKVWTIYIENVNHNMDFLYDSDEIAIRLPFCRFLFLVVFFGTIKFFIHQHGVKSDSKSFVSWNQKSYNHNPTQIWNQKFFKYNSLIKRLLRDIHWNQKQIGKCYLVSL